MTAIIRPIINLNGSDKGTLASGLLVAHDAVVAATEAMSNCMPHGRDYQTYPAQLTLAARDRHVAEMLKLRDIADYLHAMITAIAEQEDR